MALAEHSGKYLIADALRDYSEDFRLLSADNPYSFLLNGNSYSAHLSETHFADRTNQDEWRIQVPRTTRDTLRQGAVVGTMPLFLGFLPQGGGFFTAWEPAYVLALQSQTVGSVYVPKSLVLSAASQPVGVDIKHVGSLGRNTASLSFRPEFLGFYIENAPALHSALSAAEVATVFTQFMPVIESEALNGQSEDELEIGGERRRIRSTRNSFARDPRFSIEILKAYGGACCICDRQLGLVQAAHIIPHSHPDCQDVVSNGLALCVLHHKLYDDALLLPASGRNLILNQERVEHLQNIGQAAGLLEVQERIAHQYRVPDDEPSRPDDGFLDRGVRIRLGTDA